MNQSDIKGILDSLAPEIEAIVDPSARRIIKILINLVEILAAENAALKLTVQELRDEINHLKGEQGKPDIRGQSKGKGGSNHSSESERNKGNAKPPRKPKVKKTQTIKIDRQVTCEIDKADLPEDAIFKGYETRIIQDIKIITDNVEFRLPTYYSPSLNKTYIAPLPPGYAGEFGPGVRASILTFYRDYGATQPVLYRFFETFGIQIAASTIARMLTENHEVFHQEKEDIFTEGLKSSRYTHIDDTGSRVNGKNFYTHVFCNPLFTAYFTRPHKDRATILDILCRGNLRYEFNSTTGDILKDFTMSDKRILKVKEAAPLGVMSKQGLEDFFIRIFPGPKPSKAFKRMIREATAITYYLKSEYVREFMMHDDAPQFNRIANHNALCWVHMGRHFKKLIPVIEAHKKVLDDFIEHYWDYYHELLEYKMKPNDELKQPLSEKFDALFSAETGYEALDKRIAITLIKKKSLLLVLEHPFLPLHNNPAELGTRVQARIRDINLQTISENGTKTKDTFATIVQTAKKLSVNIYDYIFDRISKTFAMPSLASMIAEAAMLANNPV